MWWDVVNGNWNFPLFPKQASQMAYKVDGLFAYQSAIYFGVFVLVMVVLLYFCSAYSRKDTPVRTPRILGSFKLEIFWTISPFLIFMTIYFYGVSVYQTVLTPPADIPEVFVAGKQWMWKVQYPGGQREINSLHLPVGRPVKVTVTSEDVIHDFGIPAFRTKIDAMPGRYLSTWYHPTKTGTFDIYCDQYCGNGHSRMIGSVTVMEQNEYDAWLAGQSTGVTGPLDGSLAWQGRLYFLKLQCITCHSGNSTRARAPILEGLFNQTVPLQGGQTVKADENYIRESILNPRAKVRQGWEPIMPVYRGQLADPDNGLTEEDVLLRVVAYIKSLRQGSTPDRTDQFPAPVGAPTKLEDRK